MQQEPHSTSTPTGEVDFAKYPNAQELFQRCCDFLSEIQDLTPGAALESYLNTHYGPSSPVYQELCRLTLLGINEGWAANIPITGPNYRRSKIASPRPETRFLSITTVFVDSVEEFAGQHHGHPYGEINCVVQMEPGTELLGMQGWQGAGWTSPGPGTHHYPKFRGGKLVALFFLPAGRIAYNANPDDPQPATL